MKVKKVDVISERVIDYGDGYDDVDVKLLTKGYTYNGFFYTRKNSNFIFIVEA